MTRDELYAIIEQHVSATDEWGGVKLTDWMWGDYVCVDGIDDAVDAIMAILIAEGEGEGQWQTNGHLKLV